MHTKDRNNLSKLALFLLLSMTQHGYADCSETFGIVGGGASAPSAYFLEPKGTYSSQLLPALGTGSVNSVAMNGAGIGFISGVGNGNPFAYYAYPGGSLSPQLLPPGIGNINTVAINDASLALIGGVTGGNASAYLVYPNFSVSSNLISVSGGQINSTAINVLGRGLIGGASGAGAIAYLVYPNATTSSQLLPGATGEVLRVAINPSGAGILGGIDGSSNAFVYLVSPSATVSPQLLPAISGNVSTVAINANGVGLIGGNSPSSSPFAYFVYPNQSLSSQLLPSFPLGSVEAVALNDSKTGLIGGSTGFDPMLYIVYPNGTLSPQLLPSQTGVTVNTVAINMFGTGLAVSSDGFNSTAYLVSPSGRITSIYPTLSGAFNTAAMIEALSQIETSCLGGNSLDLAKYINKYAPEKASYFLPALVDGSLKQALKSAAPMRNAASLFTADNNLFLLNQSLSRHLRDERHVRRYDWSNQNTQTTADAWEPDDELLASLNWPSGMMEEENEVEPDASDFSSLRPYNLWADTLSAFSYQKAEHQTPGFDPITGGFIIGAEASLFGSNRIGGGAAYTYTHIHQHSGSGSSHINQEYLFAYGMWGNRHAYIDAALWSGFFQIHQVRKIHMTGFHFTSTSTPGGWQLSPHLEAGGDFYPLSWLTIEPFAMFDWANAWQGKYKEKGSGPFNMGQKEHYSSFLRSEIGIRFYEALILGSWRLTFEEKASYVNKKPFSVGTLNSFLVGSPGSFTVETLSTPQNLGVAEFAILFEPQNLAYPFGTLAYQGEFSQPYQSHQLHLELGWCF